MSGKLKVLLVTNLFPTPAEPTRGIFVLQMVRRLRETCDVRVVSPLPWFPRWSFLRFLRGRYGFALVPREYEVEGIPVHCPKYVMIPKVSESLHALLVLLGSWRTIVALHRAHRFDLLNAQWLYPDGVAAAWVSKILRIPTVLTAHGCDVNRDLNERSKRVQILRALKQADAVTVVSDAQRRRLVAEGIETGHITIIYNGVDSAIFHLKDRAECREKVGVTSARKMILYVGRLVEVKGLPYLVEAARLLAQSRDDFDVYLLGDGPLADPLRRLIEKSGLQDRVRLLGKKPYGEVALWMGACDILCLPSLQEGCPSVVLEALASGRPVVASRVGAIPDLVDASNGVLAEPEDSRQLSEALGRALHEDWDAAKIHASVSHLSWKRAADLYKAVFDEALQETLLRLRPTAP